VTRRSPVFLVAIAFVAALGGLVSPPAANEVAAATPALTIVTAARYDVRAADHLVHVTVDATAVNHKNDTATRRYYFDAATIAVMPGTRAFHASASGAKPSASVSKSTKDYRLIRIGFGRRVYSHQTFRFRLTFDLPDPGGTATRDIRIGQSLVSFPVWAFATSDTPGSSVTVVFPSGYDVHVDQGSLGAPQPSGSSIVLRARSIANAASFFAFVSGERAGAYSERAATTTVGGRGVNLSIRPWTDDAAWGARVADLFVRGLPALGGLIGLPYPRTDTLTVQEAVSRTTGGYAGLFDPSTGRIEVAYYAAPFVVLHEATHAWFNGALLVDRWANEGFASYYAELAARQLKVPASPPKLTSDLEAAKIPLNAWGAVGREDTKTESYAYAATLELARRIAERATPAGLARVWTAAAAHEAADQPASPKPGAAPETVDGPPDWRGLLDLLEARTGQRYDDLWRTWVVRPDEAALLDQRATVRQDYAATVRAAADWELPRAVRSALDAWQFDEADALLAQARAVLDRRTTLEHDAAAAKLALPDTVERGFDGDAGFRAASGEADAEIAAIKAIAAAGATRPAQLDPMTQLGLLAAAPDAALADARTAFSAGRLADAVAKAEDARNAWTNAPEIGRDLLLRVALGAIIVALLLLLAVRSLRRRSAARRRLETPADPASTAP
jgi:hypothetical protein